MLTRAAAPRSLPNRAVDQFVTVSSCSGAFKIERRRRRRRARVRPVSVPWGASRSSTSTFRSIYVRRSPRRLRTHTGRSSRAVCVLGAGRARADDNATFLCERLHAEAPSDESVGHLSACYLRQGRPKRAYALLQGAPPSSPHNRYLLALACFKLNKLHEAEGALLHDRRLRTRGPLKSQAQLLAKARAAGHTSLPPKSRVSLRTRALLSLSSDPSPAISRASRSGRAAFARRDLPAREPPQASDRILRAEPQGARARRLRASASRASNNSE